jgi:rhamnosyltransferase
MFKDLPPEVVVILSTYNGALWLPNFLESLKNQEGVKIKIIFRDDQSIDQSVQIVNEYGIPVFQCQCILTRIGPANSFMHLLSHADEKKYVAFADQDDVWVSNKLHRAITIIRKENSDLFFSSVQVGESDKVWPQTKTEVDAFSSCFENLAKGCTIVMTDTGLSNILSKERPAVVMHDHWAYFINLHVGKVSHLRDPLVIYRIHGQNAVGHREKILTLSPITLHKYLSRYLKRTKVLLEISGEFGNRDARYANTLIQEKNIFKALPNFLKLKIRSSVVLSLLTYLYLKRESENFQPS